MLSQSRSLRLSSRPRFILLVPFGFSLSAFFNTNDSVGLYLPVRLCLAQAANVPAVFLRARSLQTSRRGFGLVFLFPPLSRIRPVTGVTWLSYLKSLYPHFSGPRERHNTSELPGGVSYTYPPNANTVCQSCRSRNPNVQGCLRRGYTIRRRVGRGIKSVRCSDLWMPSTPKC